MKKRLVAIATLILLVGAFAWLVARERRAGMATDEPTASDPEEVIWRMSDAAREGNTLAYLDCFSGDLRRALQHSAAEMGEARFSEYLRRLNRETTGIAVSGLEQNGDEAELRVETVFRSKAEVQKHHFKLMNGRWQIDRIDNAEPLKVLIPYGTKVGESMRTDARR